MLHYRFFIYLLLICTISPNLSTLHAIIDITKYNKYYFQRSIHSEAYKVLPKILSEEEMKVYSTIYHYQRQRKYAQADEMIQHLDNPIILGYIYYLRFSQKDYNLNYNELKDWLDDYYDLAVASSVYKMALKFAKNAKQKQDLRKPNSFYDRFIPIYQRHNLFDNMVINKSKTPVIKLASNTTTKRLSEYLRKGKTLNVKNLLSNGKTIRTLDKDTYDYYASILGKSYFLDGDDTQAIFWLKKATKRKNTYFPEAYFTLGLVYFRLKEYDKAMPYFAYLMQHTSIFSDDIVAKGTYWYARTNLITDNITNYFKALKTVCKYKYNFYGVIACEELGIKLKYDWNYMDFPKESSLILLNNKYGERALALLQFGLLDWAEQELIFLANYDTNNMNKATEEKTLNALLYMAQNIPMPALSLKLAGDRGMFYGLSHLSYPILFVDLQSGYELDPALLLAVMRRESAFYSGAESGPGAKGMMQVRPGTADLIIKKYGLNDELLYALNSPNANIELGQKYFSMLIDNPNSDGNLIYVIAGFNAGFYKVQKWKVEEHRMPNDPLFFIESIPYAETRNYVKSVITDYWIYQTKLGISQYSLASMVQGGQPIYYSLDKEKIKALQTFAYSKDDGL